jgi:hypothetical protein
VHFIVGDNTVAMAQYIGRAEADNKKFKKTVSIPLGDRGCPPSSLLFKLQGKWVGGKVSG